MKEFLNKNKRQIKEYILPLIIIVIIVLLLEVVVFNFRHWEFIGNREPINVTDYELSDNITLVDNNAFYVDNVETRPYIELTNIDMPIDLVYFDFINVEKGTYGVLEINYQIEMTDEGNYLPYQNPERTFMRLVQKTHYSTINSYGNVHSFRVCFNNLNEGDTIRIESFVLNPQYEMLISKKRMVALVVILYLLWFIRPSSDLYKYSIGDSFKWKKWALIGVCIAEIAVFYKMSHIDHYYDNLAPGGQTQFQQLAEAIVDNGSVFLKTKPQDALVAMDNPYDANYRNSQGLEFSQDGYDMSDTGYYDGKYFVYFGVGPILLFYVPYYAITGTHIATRTVFFILTIFNTLGVPFLLYQLAKRFFKKMSYLVYLIFNVLFTFGAGQLFQSKAPDFYGVPIMMGLVLALFGLGLWIMALNKFDEKENPTLDWGYLFGGSLLMALTAISRPQFLIASFLAIILFWKSVFKDRALLSKKSIGQTIAFIAPYVVVAAGAMYYNYIRFSNPFDFGAKYNLCYNDMNFRGFHIDRFLYSVLGYMFYPSKINNVFPYIQYGEHIKRYTGLNTDEILFGGVIFNNIILILLFFVFKIRKFISDKAAFLMAVILPIVSAFLGFFDGNMAGVICRYYLDFTWGYMISAFIVLGYWYTAKNNCFRASENAYMTNLDSGARELVLNDRFLLKQYVLRLFVYVSFVITLIRWVLLPFAERATINGNQLLYHTIKNLVEFWN